MALVVSLILIFLLTAYLTAHLRDQAIRKQSYDIPNHRSAHQTPTPRGGGLAIVSVFLTALLVQTFMHHLAYPLAAALIGGGGVLALVGYYDDKGGISIRFRLLIHVGAALWAVCWLHGVSNINLGTWQLHLPLLGNLLAIFAIVLCINFYNFMDGIDGLAGSETLFVSVIAAIGCCMTQQFQLATILLLLASSTAGFLRFNWPPASIFLGDVGSTFLGYVFAVLILASTQVAALPLSFWFILLSLFFADATFTLLSRFFKGERWYEGHREHAYQQLLDHGLTHKKVSTLYLRLNIYLVMPLAMISLSQPTWSGPLAIILVIVLFIAWYSVVQKKCEVSVV